MGSYSIARQLRALRHSHTSSNELEKAALWKLWDIYFLHRNISSISHPHRPSAISLQSFRYHNGYREPRKPLLFIASIKPLQVPESLSAAWAARPLSKPRPPSSRCPWLNRSTTPVRNHLQHQKSSRLHRKPNQLLLSTRLHFRYPQSIYHQKKNLLPKAVPNPATQFRHPKANTQATPLTGVDLPHLLFPPLQTILFSNKPRSPSFPR